MLADSWSPTVEVSGPPGFRAEGYGHLIRGLEQDLADGVGHRITNVVASRDLTVCEFELQSPPEDPYHCPPGAAWVLRLRSGRVQQARLFHVRRPSPEHTHAARATPHPGFRTSPWADASGRRTRPTGSRSLHGPGHREVVALLRSIPLIRSDDMLSYPQLSWSADDLPERLRPAIEKYRDEGDDLRRILSELLDQLRLRRVPLQHTA